MKKLWNNVKNYFGTLHYGDIEPVILWICIIFYLVNEYFRDDISWLKDKNFTPILIVAVIKLMLNKIDNLSVNSDGKVGYLSDIINKFMTKKINCKKIRIFSYDSQGFYHSILGKDFFADEICVLMHKDAFVGNEEIKERWNLLIKKLKTKKVTIKLHEFDRFAYGMTFDNKLGIFGMFKPDCIANKGGLASTQNTYVCEAKRGEVQRQIIFDFNLMFDTINEKITININGGS